jgi:hypothetical protein
VIVATSPAFVAFAVAQAVLTGAGRRRTGSEARVGDGFCWR